MSKPKNSSTSSFTLETDDLTEEERSTHKQVKKSDKRPMDSNYLDDIQEPTQPTIKFNLNFDKGIRKVKEEPAQQDSGRFTIKRLFEAVSSGEVAKLQGLHLYLHKNMKRLTDSQYMSNGKTVLLKALLNLRKGENDTIEHLLDIAEKLGDLKNFVNAAYTDSFYKGQTALHVAIERRSLKFVQMLVKKGADVHAKACGKFFQPNQEMCFYFGELPLSLAACTNQPDIVDFLMDNPYQAVDVRERDSHGNTALHALVSIADDSPENTEFVIAMYDHILIKSYQLHPKIKPEEIENNKGLTPIQLAAKTGKLKLFKHIVQREFKGCRHLSRKITEWAYGPVCSSLYDLGSLDTYEKNSALEIIVYGSEIPNRHEMLHIEPLNRLLEEKWDTFAQRMFMFKFIVYIIYLFIFTAVAYNREEGIDHSNNKSLTPPFPYVKDTQGYLLQTGQIVTLIGALYFFIRGLFEVVTIDLHCMTDRQQRFDQKISKLNLLWKQRHLHLGCPSDMYRKRPRFQSLVIDGYSDQLFFLQAVLLLVTAVLYCFGQNEFLAFLVLSLALSWINLLYFFRGSKHMGIYSIMIQKMILGEIRRFLVVYMVFLIGFSAAVDTLLDNETTKKRSLFDGNDDCKPIYKGIHSTTMELFKFTIGMGDLEFPWGTKYTEVYYVLMILYIVMTYILMLNMLIALMNQSVDEMSIESTSIWKLQRAITILDMEWLLPLCLKTKLRSGEQKDLGGGKEPDLRWCFSVEEVNWNQWNRNMGIINEDPGKCTSLPSQTKPQREPSQRGLLQTFSKRRTQRVPHVQELDPLTEASTSV